MTLATLLLTGCTHGTLLIDDPDPPRAASPVRTDDAPVHATVDLLPTWFDGTTFGGCEIDSTGELWIEISAPGQGDPQILGQTCDALVSFVVEPTQDATLIVRGLDLRTVDEEPARVYESPPIGLGDLDAGESYEVEVALACWEFGLPCSVALPTPVDVALELEPSFVIGDLVGGCELAPTAALWVDLIAADGSREAFVQDCSAPTTYFVPPMDDARMVVRSDTWDPSAPFVVFGDPHIFASGEVDVGDLRLGSTTSVAVDLVCSAWSGFCASASWDDD